MKVEVCEGQESWIFEGGIQAVNFYGFDSQTAEIAVQTPHGEVLLHIHPGDWEMTQADVDALTAALRERLDERFKEREAKA
jgi:dienelactone hydrolase